MINYPKELILSRLSQYSFILLFPGFFFYHYAVGKLYIYPILGGYFGVVSIVLCFMFYGFGWKDLIFKLNPVSILFYFILSLIFIYSISNYLMGNPRGYVGEVFLWSLTGIIFNLVMFAIARYLNFEKIRLYVFFLILMFLIVILNINSAGVFYIKLDAEEDVVDSLATYQGFARSLVVISLITSAYYFRESGWFYIVTIISLVALFLNGARTEFALYLISVLFVFIFFIAKDVSILLKGFLLISILFVGIAIFGDYIPHSRMMELSSIFSSSSGEARNQLFSFALSEVFSSLQNVLIGSYGSYTAIGGVGSYPHNLFSAWINLGIIGFFAYLVLIFLLWLFAIIWYKNRSNLRLYKVYLTFLIYITLALIFSKDYSYMLVGFIVGIYSQLYYRINFKDDFK